MTTQKLSTAQQELLDAMRAGVLVRVLHANGIDAYAWRTDTGKSCSTTAIALERKGKVKLVNQTWIGGIYVLADDAGGAE